MMQYLSETYLNVPLNRDEISQSLLDIDKKTRSNPLKWKGQFSPQLVQTLLRHFATTNSIVFDPFVGSGTVLLESGYAKIKACGSEINPAAVILATIYEFINVSLENRRQTVREISKQLQHYFECHTLAFNGYATTTEETAFETETKLKQIKNNLPSSSAQSALDTLIILIDLDGQASVSAFKILKQWKMLSSAILELPFSAHEIQVFHADARCTPLSDHTIDFVLTSPPYINVFNYHQQYRKSAEFLNWNLLKVAKSEFGSNRKHRGNRFLTIIQYCLDMAQTFTELSRVCHPNARIIFVVGKESKVLGTPVYNGQIVSEIASTLGFKLIMRQERAFRNRFGQRIYEDILHFTPPPSTLIEPFTSLEQAKFVARNSLQKSLSLAPEKSVKDLEAALIKLDQVSPSPQFDLSTVFKSTEGNYV